MKLLTKLVLFFGPLALLVVTGVIILSKIQVHDILIAEVERRGLALAKSASPFLGKGVDSKNESTILPQLQQLKENAGGSYAIAFDQTGKVLAHTNISEKDKIYSDAVTFQALRSNDSLFHEIELDKKPLVDISVPIFEGEGEGEGEGDFLLSAGKDSTKRRVGTLRLGLPINETLQVQRKIFLQQTYLISIAISCLMLGLTLFLLRSVLWPTRRLVKAISHISRGQYGEKIRVLSRDELGHLTDCFNQMSQILARTTVSKDYMDAILRQMLDPLFILRPDGTIGSTNSATARLLGYSELELVGRPIEVLFTREQNPFSGDQLKKHLSGDAIQDMELSLMTKSGGMITTLFSSSILKDKEGQAAGIICAARDITERKKLETRMLQSEKLSAVGQLAAGVAHEINNPLGIILGFAQSIKSQLEPKDPSSMGLEFIEKETIRCKDLVKNLLVFSRASRVEQRDEIDILETIESALSLVTAQSRVKDVELIREFNTALPKISANKNQIQQIIINLCNNAMDAMTGSGGKIFIRTGQAAKNGENWLTLEVRDNGSGIPKEIQSKIFEPFFTTKEVGKGTGLGLSLIHEIVQKHHGTLEVESEVGKGTAFTIYLPVRAAEVQKVA